MQSYKLTEYSIIISLAKNYDEPLKTELLQKGEIECLAFKTFRKFAKLVQEGLTLLSQGEAWGSSPQIMVAIASWNVLIFHLYLLRILSTGYYFPLEAEISFVSRSIREEWGQKTNNIIVPCRKFRLAKKAFGQLRKER